MKRPGYREACSWIAWNDDASAGPDEDAIASYVSTKLVADLFGVECERVARDVARIRVREGFHGERS